MIPVGGIERLYELAGALIVCQVLGLSLHGAQDVEKSIRPGGGEAGLKSRGSDERGIDSLNLFRRQAIQSLDQQG